MFEIFSIIIQTIFPYYLLYYYYSPTFFNNTKQFIGKDSNIGREASNYLLVRFWPLLFY